MGPNRDPWLYGSMCDLETFLPLRQILEDRGQAAKSLSPSLLLDLRCHEDVATFLWSVSAQNCFQVFPSLTGLARQWCALCLGSCVVLKMMISYSSPRAWVLNFVWWMLIFYGVKTWLISYLLDRKCLKENEKNMNQISMNCRKREEFLAQLHDCLDPNKENGAASEEDFVLKVFVCELKSPHLQCPSDTCHESKSCGWV